MSKRSTQLLAEAGQLFEEALDLPEDERRALLERRCGTTGELRDTVDELLERATAGSNYLEEPLVRLRHLDRRAELRAEPDEQTAGLKGQVIGGFRIIDVLGEGGSSTVFLAQRVEADFDQHVALKLLRFRLHTGLLQRRFEEERRILARLDHPSIARLIDGGKTPEGTPFVALELVRGQSITEYCDAQELSVVDRLRLFNEACRGVEYAHGQLVVHRDLKPSNILVTAEGRPKLLDFGIAKLVQPSGEASEATATDARVLTLSYASPEHILGEPITTASDVYSLGVVLYRVLTGRLPYTSEGLSPLDLAARIRRSPPCLPSRVCSDPNIQKSLTGDIDSIVLKALRAETFERYASVEQLRQDIDRHLEGWPIEARLPSPRYRAEKFLRRHRAAMITLASILGLIVAFAVSTTVQLRRVSEERETAAKALRILTESMKQLDPDLAAGDTITLLEVLEASTQRIELDLAEQPGEQASLLYDFGRVHTSLGNYERAIDVLERSVELRRLVPKPGGTLLATSLSALGEAQRHFGEHKAAKQSLEEAAAILRQSGAGGATPGIAPVQRELGRVALDQGRLTDARQLLQQALEIQEAELGPDHPETLVTVHDLALALAAQAEFASAAERLRETLTRRKDVLGDQHRRVAETQNELGRVLRRMNEFEAAEEALEEALAIRLETLGEDHPETHESLLDLGMLAKRQGNYTVARERLERSLVGRRRAFGDDHPRTAETIYQIGRLEQSEGDYESAATSMSQALDISRRGESSQQQLVLYQQGLAGVLRQLGKLEEGEELLRTALELATIHYGAQHSVVGGLWHDLGGYLRAKGDYSAAIEAFRHSLDINREVFGPDHPTSEGSLNALGLVHLTRNEGEMAEPLLRAALDFRLRYLDSRSPMVAQSFNNLASALRQQGQFEEAGPLLRETISILHERVGKDHPHLAFAQMNLAETVAAQGQLDEAIDYLRDSVRILEGAFSDQHSYVGSALARLATVVMVRDLDDGHELIERAWHIHRRTLGAEHPSTISDALQLAVLRAWTGASAEADQLLDQVIDNRDSDRGPADPSTVLARLWRADLHLEAGRRRQAEAEVQRQVAVLIEQSDDDWRLDFGRALLEASRDRPDWSQVAASLESLEDRRGRATFEAVALRRLLDGRGGTAG